MENAYWEEEFSNQGPPKHTFVLSGNVRLTVQQVRDSLAAMQGINAPNPLYEVLVKAATDYMQRAAGNQTATEARMRAEQAQQRTRAHAEDILRAGIAARLIMEGGTTWHCQSRRERCTQRTRLPRAAR